MRKFIQIGPCRTGDSPTGRALGKLPNATGQWPVPPKSNFSASISFWFQISIAPAMRIFFNFAPIRSRGAANDSSPRWQPWKKCSNAASPGGATEINFRATRFFRSCRSLTGTATWPTARAVGYYRARLRRWKPACSNLSALISFWQNSFGRFTNYWTNNSIQQFVFWNLR